MNKSERIFCLFILTLTLLAGVFPVVAREGNNLSGDVTLETLLEKGDRVAREARFDTRTESKLRQAIRIYQKALKLDDDNKHALNMLSLGYFTLAEAYLSKKGEKKTAYRTGYEYGVKSLQTNKDFAALYDQEGFKALKDLPESVDNVEALFWTGANLGRLDETKGVLGALNDLPALISLNRRVIEVDESYLGGGAHRALGSIIAELMSRLPWTFVQVNNNDFTWDKAERHFERAIEQAPGCLESYFSYAKYYALNRGKDKFARELLNKVINGRPGEKYPLINAIAKKKARKLLEESF